MAAILLAVIFLLVSYSFESRAALITLDDESPRLEWTPPRILSSAECKQRPDNEICTNSWWAEEADAHYNRTVRLTWGPSTSVRFRFRGSLFTVYGSTLTSGASASVRIDQEPPFFFTTASSEGEEGRIQVELYSRSSLDPNTVHDVVISYNGQNTPSSRKWLVIDSIFIDEVEANTATSPTSGPTPPIKGTISADNSEGLKTATSAALGAGVGILAAAILLLLLFLRRRRQRRRIDLDAPPVSPVGPTYISGTPSGFQITWPNVTPWQLESTEPSSSSFSQHLAVSGDAIAMPPAYTAAGRTKN